MDETGSTLEDSNITRDEGEHESGVEVDASVNAEDSVNAEKPSDTSPVDDINNVSRSYIISEDGNHFVEEDVVETGDILKCEISKSYIVSDNNGNTVLDETVNPSLTNLEKSHAASISVLNENTALDEAENPFLSNLEKSHDILSVITNGKPIIDEAPSSDHVSLRQSTNMALDSLDVHNMTHSFEDVEVANKSNQEVIEGNESVNKDSYEDDPPSLKSIKSIAERKKKKLIENQTEKCVKLDVKMPNRYGNGATSTEGPEKSNLPISKENTKKEGKLFSTKTETKKVTTTKKPFSTHFSKSFSKGVNSNNICNPSKQPGREGRPQKEVEQLQILNEKERKNSLKIYQNLKSSQSKWKTEKQKICSDYEKKIQELNRKIILLRKNDGLEDESEILVTLMTEEDIKSLQKRLEQQESMIAGFQLENERLYNKLKDLEIVIKKTESQNEAEKKELFENIDDLKMTHQLEKEKLEKKLKWNEENQLLLDKDSNELKEGREKIKDLRILVERLEAEARLLRNDNAELKRDVQNKASKEQPVEEPAQLVEESTMTTCIKSNTKLVKASAFDDKKIKNSTDMEEDRTVNAYLEKRVKMLEGELEEKDNYNARRIGAIEQKYSILTAEYEDQAKQLEKRISALIIKNASEKSSAEVESNISRLSNKHAIEIGELKDIIDTKNDEISAMKVELNNKVKTDGEKGFKPISVLQKQVETLKRKLKLKETQINELNSNIISLHKDRKLLTEEVESGLNAKQLDQSPSRTFRKGPLIDSIELKRRDQSNTEEKYQSALAENDLLKRLVEELQIDREESRLRYEAVEVKSQNEIRNITEKFEEEKKEYEEKHWKTIEELKVGFAVEHSTSKMAELNGKVTGYELMIQHLKSSLEEAKIDRNKLNEMKVNKELLEQKISQLQREVIEMQNFDTPEISDYKKLVAKINLMEKNHYSREEKLQIIIENTKSKAVVDIKEIEEKWCQELHKKNMEVEKFQGELDSIIEVLKELQNQGVVITKYDHVNLPT